MGAMGWVSVDLRRDTDGTSPDETGVVDPRGFRAPLEVTPEFVLAEVRFLWRGREVRLVGDYTGRHGLVEVTPTVLGACRGDAGYRAQVCTYLDGLVGS